MFYFSFLVLILTWSCKLLSRVFALKYHFSCKLIMKIYHFSTRVFLLGPSHHYYTPKCALSGATVYKTPIGDLPIDLEGNIIPDLTYTCLCAANVRKLLPLLSIYFFLLSSFYPFKSQVKKSYNICFYESVNEELKSLGKFELMDLGVDEAEHSMEMHLPYLAKVFYG